MQGRTLQPCRVGPCGWRFDYMVHLCYSSQEMLLTALKQFLLRWLVNFFGLWTAATLLAGINYQENLPVLIWAALIFSIVVATAWVRLNDEEWAAFIFQYGIAKSWLITLVIFSGTKTLRRR